MRQRRQEVSVELRKNKKEDQIMKRRNIEVDEPTSPLQESNGQQAAVNMTLDEIIDNLKSKDPMHQFAAVQGVRKMLSRERNPPIETVINMGLVPVLINYLDDVTK